MAGYLFPAVKLSHLPSGQRSVDMRSFAQVEHLHIRQRPVPFSEAASHSRHARQAASRAARISGGVAWKPEDANRDTAPENVWHFFRNSRASDSSENLIPKTIL
jgi:hypothetical protein